VQENANVFTTRVAIYGFVAHPVKHECIWSDAKEGDIVWIDGKSTQVVKSLKYLGIHLLNEKATEEKVRENMIVMMSSLMLPPETLSEFEYYRQFAVSRVLYQMPYITAKSDTLAGETL
jgi:hypothetical protein